MLSEHKLEVLRTVEASELPVREVLDQLENFLSPIAQHSARRS